MVVFKDTIFGVSNIGVYLRANNDYFLYPPNSKDKVIEHFKQISPDIIPIQLTINGGSVLGSYIVMNSMGMIVPSIISDTELAILQENTKKNFSITVLGSEENAFGNLILCNDHGAIISSKLINFREAISEALHVPVKVLDFAGSELPGSAGKCNNFGAVVHPMIDEQDAEIIAEILDSNIDVSTINCGDPFLGGGMVVNDHGAIFGRDSTGPELQRVMEVLELE